MSATLIRGRHVIQRVLDRDRVQQVDDGAVLVRDGRIAAVGGFADLSAEAGDDETIGGPDSIVFPGLVNAHHHVGLTTLQLGVPDLPLELWLLRRLGTRAPDLYLDTLYSGFELLRSGVTTVQHIHGRNIGTPEAMLTAAEDVIRGYRALGLRVSYSAMIRDQNRLALEPDDDFIARLPDDLAGDLRPLVAAMTIPASHYIELYASLRQAHADNDKIAIQLAPANLHWCSDGLLEQIAEIAEADRALVHMHLLETPYQKAYAQRQFGHTAVEHLRQRGLLGPLMTLGHGTWVNRADLELLAETGTRICHNCGSNMRLRSGTAPLNAMLAAGLEVAIGIDEAGINDDRDMLQEMRLVLRQHREPGHDAAAVPSPAEMFRMASEYGARTTPFADRIGVLEPGRAADLVLANWSQIAYPHLDAEIAPLDALIYRAKTGGIDTVMVGGEIVLRDGRITRVDEAAALAELADMMARPPDADERRRRALARRLGDYAGGLYDGYLDDLTMQPFYGRQHSVV